MGDKMTNLEQIIALKKEMSSYITGQEEIIERLIIGLLCNGNLLVEGLPGLGKTRAIRALASLVKSDFSRIQFTPDMLPSDITGSQMMYKEGDDYKFRFEEGPIFGNIILADEINRAPAKVQAAMLEAMEERQITVAGATHKLPKLFMVMATQNPIEQEGTYPLPEAQMDRFMLKIEIGYLDKQSEIEMIDISDNAIGSLDLEKFDETLIFAARDEVASVAVSDAIKQYIVDIVFATRYPDKLDKDLGSWIVTGASPRGTLSLIEASKSYAWLQGRDAVIPDDVKAIAHDVLRHRITTSYAAQSQKIGKDQIIDKILELTAVSV